MVWPPSRLQRTPPTKSTGVTSEDAAKRLSSEGSALRSAPNTATMVTSIGWDHAHTREEAASPLGTVPDKYWPPVQRVDGAAGDRNLICSCPPLEA